MGSKDRRVFRNCKSLLRFVSFRLGVSQAAFRWHWPPLWLLFSLLSYQFWLLGGTSKSCSAWWATGSSSLCRTCRTCSRTCLLPKWEILPSGCNICDARCNFSSSFTWSVSELSNDKRHETTKCVKIFPKGIQKDSKSACLEPLVTPQVLGSYWGSRLYSPWEARLRLRTVPNPIYGRGGRNPGARVRGWNWGWRRWVS